MLRYRDQYFIMGTFVLTLVRHGETAENKLKIAQGHMDTKLTEVGIGQATLVGQHLEDENFSHVFSSDLSRAHETCKIILKQNKVSSAVIKLDSRLRERNLGKLEGLPIFECYKVIKDSKGDPPEGLEAKIKVRVRAQSFFKELCRTITESITDPSRTSSADGGPGCPCGRENCKCRPVSFSPTAATPPDPSEPGRGRDHLCNADSVTSNHLNNGASPAPEKPLGGKTGSSLESSSDEEHLGITPDVLQLGGGRDHPIGTPDVDSEDRSSALKSPRSKLASREGPADDKGPSSPVDGCALLQHHHHPRRLANVLLVSHGGFLLELIDYFFKELKCEKPRDRSTDSDALPSKRSIMSNAGLSRFAFSVRAGSNKPAAVSCTFLNDRKHLAGEDAGDEDGDLVC